ncbi:MAG: hypothetical protein RL077_3958 [Verrucomicrobiota bacterium]
MIAKPAGAATAINGFKDKHGRINPFFESAIFLRNARRRCADRAAFAARAARASRAARAARASRAAPTAPTASSRHRCRARGLQRTKLRRPKFALLHRRLS